MKYTSTDYETNLPRGCIPPEECEGVLEPVVDVVQGQLVVRRFEYGLQMFIRVMSIAYCTRHLMKYIPVG